MKAFIKQYALTLYALLALVVITGINAVLWKMAQLFEWETLFHFRTTLITSFLWGWGPVSLFLVVIGIYYEFTKTAKLTDAEKENIAKWAGFILFVTMSLFMIGNIVDYFAETNNFLVDGLIYLCKGAFILALSGIVILSLWIIGSLFFTKWIIPLLEKLFGSTKALAIIGGIILIFLAIWMFGDYFQDISKYKKKQDNQEQQDDVSDSGKKKDSEKTVTPPETAKPEEKPIEEGKIFDPLGLGKKAAPVDNTTPSTQTQQEDPDDWHFATGPSQQQGNGQMRDMRNDP